MTYVSAGIDFLKSIVSTCVHFLRSMRWELIGLVAIYVLLRFAIWAFATFIASIPSLNILGGLPAKSFEAVPMTPYGLMTLTNQAGHFRDVFFILVPAAAITLSACCEFLWSMKKKAPRHVVGHVIFALFICLFILVSALAGFLKIPDSTVDAAGTVSKYVMPDPFFTWATWGIQYGLLIGLVIELWVTGAAEKIRLVEDEAATKIRKRARRRPSAKGTKS